MYSEDDIDRFDADFRKQIHFNFAATRNTQKQKQSQEATRASRLRDIDLDVIQRDTTTVTTNRSDLSRYILEDILDCPPGSRFIICIATDAVDVERGYYYSKTATLIANKISLAEGECEYWKMCGRRYFVRQARIDRSSHYSEIKMKAVSSRQFLDAFDNEGGDFAFQFEGTPTKLTIPWRDIINASKTVMLFGAPFSQGRSFPELFRKKKAQHAHHIFRQFASEYYGDSRACAMLCIAYQQARLDAAVADLVVLSEDGSTSLPNSIFKESSFNTT
jgi:hypothetical protein